MSTTFCLAQDHIMHTQTFDLTDGLSSTQITNFYQDSRGVIWLGTTYGLNSYDGAQFKSYTKEDGLAHNYVLEISEDNLGNLWIRSGDFSDSKYFLTIYIPESDTFRSLENYIGSESPFHGGDLKVHKQTLGSNIINEKFEGKQWFYELKNKKIKKLFNIPFEKDKMSAPQYARRFGDNLYRVILYKILKDNNWIGLQYEYDIEASQLTQLGIKSYTNVVWSSMDQEIEMVQDLAKFDSLLNTLSSIKYTANNTLTQQYSNFHTFENQLIVLNRKDLKLLYFDLKTVELVKEISLRDDF